VGRVGSRMRECPLPATADDDSTTFCSMKDREVSLPSTRLFPPLPSHAGGMLVELQGTAELTLGC